MGFLAIGATPNLLGNITWDAIVQGITLHLLYHGEIVTEHCPPQTAGSCYTKERGMAPQSTLCSHHQGSESQMASSGGTTTMPGRYQGMLPTGYTWEEDQATVYSWGDIGTGGKYKHYEGGNAASGDQANCPLSDAMVMWVSADPH